MKQNRQDTRRHPRVTVDVQANVRTNDGRKLPARTRDLSRSGICLITTAALPAGEILKVDLILVFGQNSISESLPLRARVVWCTSIAKAYQIGAAFDFLSSKEASFLEMFLKYLDGTILPMGAEMETMESERASEADHRGPVSPGDKDDPFCD
jgi:hypothetical protein